MNKHLDAEEVRFADHVGRYFSALASLDTEKSFESHTESAQALSSHPCSFTAFTHCGDDCRNFEQIGRFNYSNVDRIIRKLRRIYQEKPDLFDIPTFTQKIY
jgi:hypothetical protein